MSWFKDRAVTIENFVSLIVLGTVCSAHAQMQFHSFDNYSHSSIQINPAITYNIEPIIKDQKAKKVVGLRLYLQNINLNIDEAKRMQKQLELTQDNRTESISINYNNLLSGLSVSFDFNFSKKAQEQGVEYFSYRNKDSSELNIDYWLTEQLNSKSKTYINEKTAKKNDDSSTHPKIEPVAHYPLKAIRKKRILKESHKNNHEDHEEFFGCGKPLKYSEDGYAFWKTYHKHFNYKEFFNLKTADSNYKYPYAIKQKNEKFDKNKEKEISYYRLALKLYNETQYALVLRTIDFFKESYPESELNLQLAFLKANTLLKLSNLLKTNHYDEEISDMFRSFVFEHLDEEVGKASLAYLVQEMMESSAPLNTLELVLLGAEKKEVNKNQDGTDQRQLVFRLAAAELLYKLGEYDRAERAYQLVLEQNSPLAPEAAFRIGEVFSVRKIWFRAILAYEQAFKKFPEESRKFPTAWLNLAEAYLQMNRAEDSERVYRDFMKLFSNDPEVWAAAIRIAEFHQMKIKKSNIALDEKIQTEYEDVINRYPYTPGAMMAELRLAVCHKSEKNDVAEEFFNTFFNKRELKRFENKLVDPKEVEAWVDLAETKFYINTHEYDKAFKYVVKYKFELNKHLLGESFKNLFNKAIIGEAVKKSHHNSEADVMAVFNMYDSYVLEPKPFPYTLAIVKAAQSMNDLEIAQDKLEELRKIENQGSQQELDWYHLLSARQQRLLGKDLNVAISELEKINDDGELVIEKYDELAQTAVLKKDYKKCISYNEKLLGKKLYYKMPNIKKITTYVRHVDALNFLNRKMDVIRIADEVILKFGALSEFNNELSMIRDLRVQALYESGLYEKAIQSFSEIFLLEPEHKRLDEFTFEYGKSLLKLGRNKEAFDSFQKLISAPSTTSLWKQSAQVELDQLQWDGKISNLTKKKDRRSSQ